MNPRYPRVAERAGHRCEYCHAPEVIFNFAFEVEHVIPLGLQRIEDDSNLALACRSCNLFKANHLLALDEFTGTEFPLFNPRKDQWEDHFQLDRTNGEIRGLTPVGRATITCLQMNSTLQLLARHQWLQLGLFP
jgi:hypothetical protein